MSGIDEEASGYPMTFMRHEQEKGWGVVLFAALLLLIHVQAMPGWMPNPTGAVADHGTGPCLPSCEAPSGVQYKAAAILPVAASAIPESLKRPQYDGPDRLLAGSWQGASNYPAITPPFPSNAERQPERSRVGSGKLCTLLCIYRL